VKSCWFNKQFCILQKNIKIIKISFLQEDLDAKLLRIQNKNLSERLVQRQKLEAELREKIQRLQNRKVNDDNKLCLIDRFWTQLDEDLRIIMERFDSESISGQQSGGSDTKPSGSSNNSTADSAAAGSTHAVRKFLAKLNDWDKEEIEELLVERVKFTTQTVAKLVLNFDRFLIIFFNYICKLICSLKKYCFNKNRLGKKRDVYYKELVQVASNNTGSTAPQLDLAPKIKELSDENTRLGELVTKCQDKAHSAGLEVSFVLTFRFVYL
jgi:hypothetical protein